MVRGGDAYQGVERGYGDGKQAGGTGNDDARRAKKKGKVRKRWEAGGERGWVGGGGGGEGRGERRGQLARFLATCLVARSSFRDCVVL